MRATADSSTTSRRRKSSRSRSKESVRVWLRLLSCESVVEQQLRTLFRSRFSVTLPQFDVLSELERAGSPLTMSQLSRELMVSNGNVTGVIDRLEKSGLVDRSRAEHDRRIQFIRLTPQGRKQFNEMARCHEAWLEALFADIAVSDLQALQESLVRLRNAVRSQASDGG